ncbi:MAG: DNA-binding response regulator [Alkalinema sp. CACIAM 70d]|nr:MAG: DNA-binding response regulator [Alkalinema sp. CACIAM 70d]
MRILLVDDEAEMAEPLSRMLEKEGYQVEVAYDGDRGDRLAMQGQYDLLILDWMLPQKSGLEICQHVRSRGDVTPVLFLTAKDTIDDRVEGLDAGADDYLVKPFELRELLARVRALLRRPAAIVEPVAAAPLTPTTLSVDGLELNVLNQLASRNGRSIELSEKETQLLAYLMESPNQLLTHEQISQHLWATEEKPASNALAAQIRLLRRKIEAPGEDSLIHTVYGKGYRFGNLMED